MQTFATAAFTNQTFTVDAFINNNNMGAFMKTNSLDSIKKNAVAEFLKEKFTAAAFIKCLTAVF